MDIMEIAKKLADEKVVELPDGRSIRLRLDDDTDTYINDFADCYGRVEYVCRGYIGHAERPEWADGAAKKVWAGNECYWWRPPSDILGDKELIKHYENLIHDLLIYGWQIVFVEVLDSETDAYNLPIVREMNCLGGVEWFIRDEDGRAEIVADILSYMELPVMS